MRTTLLGCLLLGMVAGVVQAQPVRGDHELQLGAGFFHRQGSDEGNLNVSGIYGYYLNPVAQIGFEQSLFYQFIEDQDDIWTAATLPFFNIHLRWDDEQTILPYFGGAIGVAYNDEDVDAVGGPQAGVKFFATEHVFIAPQYRYEWFFDEAEFDEGNHVGTLNIGFVFGGDRDDDDDRDRYRSSYDDPRGGQRYDRYDR